MPGPQAAVTILHARQPVESVLLMRRAEHDGDPWSGQWSLPGGRCEPGDQHPAATALRELAEECGITLPADHARTALAPTTARRSQPPYLLVAPFVFHLEQQIPARVDGQEAVEALWMPLAFFTAPGHHRVQPVPGQPRHLAFPSVNLAGPPLWGFTYRLLTEWLGLLPREHRVASLGAADDLLGLLVAEHLEVREPWRAGLAEVRGTIPVERVLAYLAEPRLSVPAVNRVEVSPSLLCITGLEMEEYRIRAIPPVSARGW